MSADPSPQEADAIDDQMAASFAQWLKNRPPKVVPPPVLVTTPVVDDRWLTYKKAAEEVGCGLSTLKTHHSGARTDTGWLPVAVGNAPCRLMIPDSCRYLGRWVPGFYP
jgi:hypothetical protein